MASLRRIIHGSIAAISVVSISFGSSAAEKTIELADGSTVMAEYGRVFVPERRDRSNGEYISLRYIKVLGGSAVTGSPIIYLRGGPGVSGTALLGTKRFAALFHGIARGRDVVLFDQRGTGETKPRLHCGPPVRLPMIPAPTSNKILETTRKYASNCAGRLREQGIDLAAYNTNESADDVADLAGHLGYDRVMLFGMSYGSHLGLTVIRRHKDLIELAILGFVVGPDDIFRRPLQFDSVLSKLDAIAQDRKSGWPYSEPPSVTLEQSLKRFDKPMRSSRTNKSGRVIEVEINRTDVEISFLWDLWENNRTSRQSFPDVIDKLRDRDISNLAERIRGVRTIARNPMRSAMLCSSGVSAQRQALIEEELRTSVLSLPPGFPHLQLCDAWGLLPLPPSFREPVVSDIPILLISGELDQKTPSINAETVAKGFSKATHFRVAGLGHEFWNAYEKSSDLRAAIRKYLDGEPVSFTRFDIPFKFLVPDGLIEQGALHRS